MNNNIVDKSTLGEIHRKLLIEDGLSASINKRREDYNQFVESTYEPLRRLEFNVLLSICENSYKPYNNLRIQTEEYKDYGKPKLRYYISIPKMEIEDTLPLLDDKNTNVLETIEHAYNKTRAVFRHREPFKQFNDEMLIQNNKLYKKLFGLTVDNSIKVLYFFLSSHKYDFLDTIQKYPRIYEILGKLDNYLSYRGYHKCVLSNTL